MKRTILIALVAAFTVSQVEDNILVGKMCADHTRAQRLLVAKKAEMTDAIVSKYKVDRRLARDVVALAIKYEQPTFPKAKDIVAIIGMESSFDPSAKSKLKTDPAEGLMQIRPRAWSHKIKREDLAAIDGQIKHGSQILAHYYKVLDGNKVDAIGAYNIGLRNYKEGKQRDAAERYQAKYGKEIVAYQAIEAKYAK